VGIISLVNSANLLGRTAASAVRTALRPTLAQTIDEGDDEQTLHLYQATTRWMFTADLPAFLVAAMYPAAILSLFGESFEAGATALVIVVTGELAAAATGTTGTLIDMSRLNTLKTINKIVEVALTIAVNVVFISQWGLLGAAYAFLVSRTVTQFGRLIEVWVIMGFHPYNLRILKPIGAAIAAFAAGTGIDQLLPAAEGVSNLLVNAVVVLLVYVGTLVLLGLSEEDKTVVSAIVARLRRRHRRARA
jgi:O-antigen/teichoic acid export membrane protein